ncbi:MAG: hypothetical protein FJX56_06620, partial [Alphaproteobacteria bacterium]|nr:hypothetical protein [Alphaproteobacteria bacterium]
MPRLGAGIAGAVVAGALALASPSAGADDDVARRLDQLEALVESQQAQIEALTKRLAEVQAAPPAPELMMTSSEPKVKVSLFGQVNRAVLYYDDGAAADVR